MSVRMTADPSEPIRLRPPRPRRALGTLVEVVRREMALRHRGAALGVLWPLLDPVLLIGAYALVLGGILDVGAPGEARALAGGLLPWSFLAASWAGCATAFPGSAGMLRSLDVEPGFFALAPALAALPGFLLGVALVAGIWGVPSFPLAIVLGLHLVTVLAGGVLLAFAALRLPDLIPAVHPGMRLLFFATPVLYPASRVPEAFAPALAMHPLVPLFENWRAVVEGTSPPAMLLLASLAWATLLAGAAGLVYRMSFRKVAALA